MSSKSVVIVDNEKFNVDPQLFFQRLVVFIRHADIEEAFAYELLTGNSSKGSMFTEMLGGEKGSVGDEAL